MSRINSQLKFDDLTGGLNNVYTKEQLNSSTRKTETPDMVNVEYFKLGGLKTMNGNTYMCSNNSGVQSSAIVGGWEYIKGDRKYMMIGLANGEVRMYDKSLDFENQLDNPFRLIYKFPTPTKRINFCNMNNGVVVTNGIDDLLFFEHNRVSSLKGNITTYVGNNTIYGDGTKFSIEIKVGDGININGDTYYIESIEDNGTAYTTEPIMHNVVNYKLKLADTSLCNAYLINSDKEVDPNGDVHVPARGLAIQYYSGRLWIGGKTGLFYSAVGLPNNWDIQSDAGAIYDTYNDGSEVMALGLYSEYLMVHRKLYTYLLSLPGQAGGDDSSLEIKPFSNITCESQQSWIACNTKYFVYSKEFMDVYPLLQHTIFNDKFLGEPITQKVRNIFKDLIKSETKNIFCLNRPKERQMVFYLPTNNCSGSGEALIYDFQTKSWLLRRLPRETNVTIAFNFDSEIYIGTKDGLILKEFSGDTFTILDTDNEGNIKTKTINGIEEASISISDKYQYPKQFLAINYFNNTLSQYACINGDNSFDKTENDTINRLYDKTWIDGVYVNDTFYIISKEGYISSSYYSNGNIEWNECVLLSGFDGSELASISYGNDRFVIISKDGKITTSSDYISWSDVISPTNLENEIYNSNSVPWVNMIYDNLFIVISRRGKISTSSDGLNWSEQIEMNWGLTNRIHNIISISKVSNRYIILTSYGDSYIFGGLSSEDYITRVSFHTSTPGFLINEVPFYSLVVGDKLYSYCYNYYSYAAIPSHTVVLYKTSDGENWEKEVCSDFISDSNAIVLYKSNDTNNVVINVELSDNTILNSNEFLTTYTYPQDIIDYFYTYYNPETLEGDYNFYINGNIYTIPIYSIDYEKQEIETEKDVPLETNVGLNAYYKSPWFDWSGNYRQSFAEFFVECESDYKNKFIIRTQKDGTSRYEDRKINEDKFIERGSVLVWDDTNKHWGGFNEEDNKEYKNNKWTKVEFDTIRMLLPNNVFESFQLELRATEPGDGFHIYQYGFRRIETEEAPW